MTNTWPTFQTNPQLRTLVQGNNTFFTVKVTNTATLPLSYQWNLNGTPISGQTATNLFVTNAQTLGVSSYSVSVTSPAGVFTTTAAHGLLTVNTDTVKPVFHAVYPANNARLTNNVIDTHLGISATGPNFTETAFITDNGLITNVSIQRIYPSVDAAVTAALIYPNSFMSNGNKASFTNTLSLKDGTNIYILTATDSAGNFQLATQKIFFVNNSTPLTVHTNGSGACNTTISPVAITIIPPATTASYPYGIPANGALLEIGHLYQIKATLHGNTVFSNWTDGNGNVLAPLASTNVLTLASR